MTKTLITFLFAASLLGLPNLAWADQRGAASGVVVGGIAGAIGGGPIGAVIGASIGGLAVGAATGPDAPRQMGLQWLVEQGAGLWADRSRLNVRGSTLKTR